MTKFDEARVLLRELDLPVTNINAFMVAEALERRIEVGAMPRRPRIVFMHGSEWADPVF
ncbi:hypothetical protein [Citricoccus sp. NR2]|uniref:hypothetical protein n=1 Tax=Citricoccus sp. NR2 TaxID=3004095 RepID=UPI0022DD3E28|nr:hypothetical protein [Citricoccus sp. NR2]WBL19773.1 hypothetical protein O1A05_03505 [Citricoccus sp. NR2]